MGGGSPSYHAAQSRALLRSRVDELVNLREVTPQDRLSLIAGVLISGLRVVSVFGATTVALLLTWIVAPTFVPGWHSTAVESGSMGPSIERGDVVILRPPDEPPLPEETVVRFESDDGGGSILHRIVSADAELSAYVTRGDANLDHDSALVPFDAVEGVGTFLVPLVGMPVLWFNEGRYLHVLLVLFGAVCIASPAMGFGSDDDDDVSGDLRAPGPLTASKLDAATRRREFEALFPPELVARLKQERDPVP